MTRELPPMKRIYRIVVTKWPTADGKPWPAFIRPAADGSGWVAEGDVTLTPLEWVPFDSEDGWPNELNHRIRTHDIGSEFGILEYGVLDGMVLPGSKRYYQQRPLAERWICDARLLGAECHLEVGAVTWGAES